MVEDVAGVDAKREVVLMPRVAATHHHWAASSSSAHYHLSGAATESSGAPAASILISASATLIGVAVAALVTLITLGIRLAVCLVSIRSRRSGASEIVGRGAEAKSFRYAEIDTHKSGPPAKVARDGLFTQQRSGIEDTKARHNRSRISGSGEPLRSLDRVGTVRR